MQRSSRPVLTLTAAGLVLAALACSHTPGYAGNTARYSLIDLGHLGGNTSAATAVNASNAVVGWSLTQGTLFAGPAHAFLWRDLNGSQTSDPGEMIDLGTLGGRTSQAWAINASNQVVGGSEVAQNVQHAFLWQDLNGNHVSDPGEMIDLGTLGGEQSTAYGINDQGQVIGTAQTASGEYHPFLWEDLNGNFVSDPGEMIDLGTFGGDFGTALGINNQGVVVGGARDASDLTFAFAWEDRNGDRTSNPGEMVNLGTLGGLQSGANGINNAARPLIVGSADLPAEAGEARHAAAWQDANGNGQYGANERTDLGALLANGTFARSVNSHNQVVGYSLALGVPAQYAAFLWENGTLRDLNTLVEDTAFVLREGNGINDGGYIAVTGQLNSRDRALLLKPNGDPQPVEGADLTGTAGTVEIKVKGRGRKATRTLKASLTVRNAGTKKIKIATKAQAYLSADATLDKSDSKLGVVNVPVLKAGAEKTLRVSAKIPKRADLSQYDGQYVIVVLDAKGKVAETDETNNTIAVGPIAAL
ncbi:MAG: CARDB domain-containing protein [Armatimonadota bacterium]